MNRRILSRIMRRLSAKRTAAKRAGKGVEAHKAKVRADVIRGLMA